MENSDLHESLIKVLANAWINLDATELLNYIHPEFKYDSQWVLQTIPDSFGETMIHLNQQVNHGYLSIRCKDNRIIKMDMCMF